jgi:hypothetical protein
MTTVLSIRIKLSESKKLTPLKNNNSISIIVKIVLTSFSISLPMST